MRMFDRDGTADKSRVGDQTNDREFAWGPIFQPQLFVEAQNAIKAIVVTILDPGADPFDKNP